MLKLNNNTQDPETARQQKKLAESLRALHEASGKAFRNLRKPCSQAELNTITRALHVWLLDEVSAAVQTKRKDVK